MKKLARLLGAVLVLGLLFCGTAFAELSGDVTITVTSDDTITFNTKFASTAKVSGDTAIETISADVTFPSSAESAVILLTFASSDGVTSVDVSFDVVAGVALASKDTVSFDLVKLNSADFYITLTINLSNDTASGDNKLTVKIVNTSADEAEPFDSATFTLEVDEDSAGGIDPETYEATSADEEFSESFTASTDVSEITITIESESDVLYAAFENGDWTVESDDSSDNVVLTVTVVSEDSLTETLHVYMASGDITEDEANSVDIALTFTLDDGNEAGDTYVLNAGAIYFIGSDSAKTTKTVRAKTTYTTSQDAPENWDAVDFEVSSADLATFTVTVSTDNTIVAAYDATDKTSSVLSGDNVIDFSGVVGEYVVVFSADLVLSTDEETTTTSDDTAYFSVTVTLTQAKEDTPSGLKKTTADDAATSSDQSGNSVIAGGQTIDTKFLTNGTLTADTVSSFFGSANTIKIDIADDDTLRTLLTAMNLTESAMGNDTDGYKAVALGLPAGVTLNAGDKFFVIITTSLTGEAGSKRAIGIGVLSANQVKTAGYLPIVFNLLRDPTDTNKYMGFDPDEYYVGATNDTASSDSGTTTRVVVVTAAGDFAIQSKEKTLLQGQNATTGAAVPYEDSGDDDDDDQETSSHGSSSGCDAGFGALALLAVAGALAARKVRK